MPVRFPHGWEPHRIFRDGDWCWSLFVAQVVLMCVGAVVLIALLM